MEPDVGLIKTVLMIFPKMLDFMRKPGKKRSNRLREIEEVILLAYDPKRKNEDIGKVFLRKTAIDPHDTLAFKALLANSEAPLLEAAFLKERSGDNVITDKGIEYIDGMNYDERRKLEQKYKL